jgi:hypothetical protein
VWLTLFIGTLTSDTENRPWVIGVFHGSVLEFDSAFRTQEDIPFLWVEKVYAKSLRWFWRDTMGNRRIGGLFAAESYVTAVLSRYNGIIVCIHDKPLRT